MNVKMFRLIWISLTCFSSFAFASLPFIPEFLSGLFTGLSSSPEVVDDLVTIGKLPLPSAGTTACSSYPHVKLRAQYLQRLCFTQRFYQQSEDYAIKCRTQKQTVGLPVANIPLQKPLNLSFVPETGYSYVEYLYKNGTSKEYKFSFVEVQVGEQFNFVTNDLNSVIGFIAVFPHFTEKGYVQLICPLTDLKKPICSLPSTVVVCTYNKSPPTADVDALVGPLNSSPFFFGKNLHVLNTTNCVDPTFSRPLSELPADLTNPIGLVEDLVTSDQLSFPDLDATGVSACSSLKNADRGVENFQNACYVQRETPGNVTMNCKIRKFTLDSPDDLSSPLTIILDLIPNGPSLLRGYSSTTYRSPIDSSAVIEYNDTFLEVKPSQMVLFSTEGDTLLGLKEKQVVVHYSNIGYTMVSCPMNHIDTPICTGITYACVCTYKRDAKLQDIQDLLEPLNHPPYHLGNSLNLIEQNSC